MGSIEEKSHEQRKKSLKKLDSRGGIFSLVCSIICRKNGVFFESIKYFGNLTHGLRVEFIWWQHPLFSSSFYNWILIMLRQNVTKTFFVSLGKRQNHSQDSQVFWTDYLLFSFHLTFPVSQVTHNPVRAGNFFSCFDGFISCFSGVFANKSTTLDTHTV